MYVSLIVRFVNPLMSIELFANGWLLCFSIVFKGGVSAVEFCAEVVC